MKNLNAHEGTQRGFLGRVVHGVADRLEQMAVDPRGCWNFIIYEPELTDEIMRELATSNNV